MKKIFAFLIISLFLLSVVSAQPLAVKANAGKNIVRPDLVIAKKMVGGEDLDDCIERLSKINPDASEEELKRICELRKVRELKPVARLAKVKELKKENFREFQKQQLQVAIEKCKEKSSDPELCEKNLEKRIQLIDRSKEGDLERLRKIEERKIKKLEELDELKQKPEFAKYKKVFDFKARVIPKEKLLKSKERYLSAKKNYLAKKENYVNAQNKFKEIKTELRKCEGINSTECDELRERIRESAKDYLVKIADMILAHLEKIKENIESNEDLSEEEVAELLEKINDDIEKIEEAKHIVETSESKEEIQEAARILKREWSKIQGRLKVYTGRIVNARIGGVIVQIKQLEVKLERVLARIEEKGLDTTIVESLIDEFNTKVNESKDNYEKALEKFKEAASKTEVNEIVKEGHEYMKAAQKALQEAREILREIVLSINQAGGEEELTAEEDEAEEE